MRIFLNGLRVSVVFLFLVSAACFAKDEQFLETAQTLLEANRLEEATVHLRKAIGNAEIGQAELHLLLGAIHNVNKKFAEALSEFKQVKKIKPASTDADGKDSYYREYKPYEKDDGKGFEFREVLAERAPLDYGVQILLGDAYSEDLNYSDLKLYEKRLPKDLNAKMFFALGVFMRRSDAFDRAIRAYRMGLTIAPDFQFLKENLIDALHEYKGEIEKSETAIKEYDDLILISPSDNNEMALAEIYFAKDKEKAIDFYKRLIAKYPPSADRYWRIAHIYGRCGKFPEAIESFKKAKELSPENLAPDLEIGKIYVILKQWDAALEVFRLCKKYDIGYLNELEEQIVLGRYFGFQVGENGEISITVLRPEVGVNEVREYLIKAEAFEKMSDRSKAIEELKKSLRVKETASANFEIGRLLWEGSGCSEEPVRYYKKAIALSPDEPWFYGKFASMCVDCGMAQEVIPLLRAFLKKHPDDAFALYTLSFAMHSQSQYWQDALEVFERLKFVDKVIFGLVEDKYQEIKAGLKDKKT
jgi:tetratricopeptide (TPR) repeat protein